ncbi:MAG: TrkA-C domain protein [Methanothrix sp.]|jgi:di/tricarboxylate transporter|nr:MAG: TrkA-C domain protein [Methanothrix sp.]
MGMTTDQLLIFAILGLALLLFIWGRWRYDLVAIIALLVATISGVVPWSEAFTGFAHPAVVTVGAILIVSRSLLNSGIVDLIQKSITSPKDSTKRQVRSLTGIVSILSGFMNNVGALAILLPVSLRVSRRTGNPPSLLLMPLAFASLLGGLLTLIGTPPNIIVASYRAEVVGEPFRMFDFTPVGGGVLLVGLLFIWFFGWKLTPRRKGGSSKEDLFKIENYITEIWVSSRSKLVGKRLRVLKQPPVSDMQILGLVRGDLRIPMPTGDEILEPGDILAVETSAENIKYILKWRGLELLGGMKVGKKALLSKDVGLIEAVVAADSPMVGETARSLSLGRRYDMNLIAVARRGEVLVERLREIAFQPGDVLLMQGPSGTIPEVLESLGCLPLAERGMKLGRRQKSPLIPLLIFGGALAATAGGLLPVEIAFAAAAVGMVLAGVLTIHEAYESIDWPIIFLLGALIPVGAALESTGGAEMISGAILLAMSPFPAAVLLAALLAWTMILTNIINNAAAAVIMAPIAFNAALVLELSADPFLMAVAVGASCAFLTPIGHQSNTLVMGPGGYQFGDYWRLGLPLSIVAGLAAVPLILIFWPL